MINVVPEDRMQFMWFSLYGKTEFCRIVISIASAEFLAECGDRLGQVISYGRRGTQVLDRVPTLQDRLVGMIESLFEGFLRCTRWEHVACRLEMKHQGLKALQ